MIKYDKYLINSVNRVQKVKWDEEAVRTSYEIIDPDTALKLCDFQSEAEAKKYIDNHLTEEGRITTKRLKQDLDKQIERVLAEYRSLCERRDELMKYTSNKVWR